MGEKFNVFHLSRFFAFCLFTVYLSVLQRSKCHVHITFFISSLYYQVLCYSCVLVIIINAFFCCSTPAHLALAGLRKYSTSVAGPAGWAGQHNNSATGRACPACRFAHHHQLPHISIILSLYRTRLFRADPL